jgi:hypothetical protein
MDNFYIDWLRKLEKVFVGLESLKLPLFLNRGEGKDSYVSVYCPSVNFDTHKGFIPKISGCAVYRCPVSGPIKAGLEDNPTLKAYEIGIKMHGVLASLSLKLTIDPLRIMYTPNSDAIEASIDFKEL